MAGRGPQSFKKRQKEQQRKEKQQEKLARKMERRLQPPVSEDESLAPADEGPATADAEGQAPPVTQTEP